jgi:hypothetical protein
MTVDAIRSKLAKLERLEVEAANAVRDAKARLAEGKVNGLLLLHDICTYEHGVLTRRPGFKDNEATRRQLTTELAQKLIDGVYVAVPVDPGVPARGIVFHDRSVLLLIDQLETALEGARQVRRSFYEEHRDILREDEQRRKMERYRRAVEGDDPIELLEAQRALGVLPETALTTEDL